VRVRAGEDARAVVCVTARTPEAGIIRRSPSEPGPRCRSSALVGNRPVDIELAVPAGFRAGYDLQVELAAQANAARKTVVVRSSG
jgi:hypothetical protein